MTSLFITISGCSGGHRGPQEIYSVFKKNNNTFLSLNTIPDNIRENVDLVAKIALQNLNKDIYLVGHSMGSCVALLSAYELNKEGESRIKGVVLLAPQTEGLALVNELNIPILFFHGEMDTIFPIREIEPTYQSYTGRKMMIQIAGAGHSFAPKEGSSKSFTRELAKRMLLEISHFFNSKSKGKKAISISYKQSTLSHFISSIFSANSAKN